MRARRQYRPTAKRPSPVAAASPGRHEFVGGSDAPRLDVLIAAQLDLSRNHAATLIANGHVLVNGRREKASYKTRVGEKVVVELPAPAGRDIIGESIPLDIVHEDDDVLVIAKAAGMVVHPAPGNWSGTLVNALKGRGGPLSEGTEEGREGIVHRLDKQTSGLLLVAKTDRAHRVLGAALQARQIRRRYAALSWGHLVDDEVTVDKPLARDPRDRTRVAVVATGRQARTDFVRLARFESVDLLRAHLHTGRTHQIRVHLAAIGHPIVGDDTYGGGGGRRLMGLPPERHFLHAAWLTFIHPVSGRSMEFRSPLPPDLVTCLNNAAGEDAPPAGTDALEHFGFYRTVD
jgi:23S rRNA pseudouridine1911/1915/1917 synthase